MKSYTDLEQSKKLVEFLQLESADMGYLWNGTSFCEYPVSKQTIFKKVENIPCWSLAALLNIIPWCQVNRMTNSYKWEASSWTNSNIVSKYYVEGFDTPIDACCELILKLHEQNLL